MVHPASDRVMVRDGELGQQKDTTQIDPHEAVPVGDTQMLAVGEDVDTRVVDDDVDAAKGVDGGIDEIPDSGFVGNIGLDEARLTTHLTDFLRRRRRRVLLVVDALVRFFLDVGHDHSCPLTGKLQTDPSADHRSWLP